MTLALPAAQTPGHKFGPDFITDNSFTVCGAKLVGVCRAGRDRNQFDNIVELTLKNGQIVAYCVVFFGLR